MSKREFGEPQSPSSGGILIVGLAKDLFEGTSPEMSASCRCRATTVSPDPNQRHSGFPSHITGGKDGDLQQNKTENSGSPVALLLALAFPFPLK